MLELLYKAVVLEACAEHVAQAVTRRVVDAVDLVCAWAQMGDRAQNAEKIGVVLPCCPVALRKGASGARIGGYAQFQDMRTLGCAAN